MNMLPLRRWLSALSLPFLLVACSQAKILDTLSIPEDRALAKAAINDLLTNRPATLLAKMQPELRPQLATQFRPMREAMPFDVMTGVTLVDASWFSFKSTSGANYRDSKLAYEIVSGDHRALAQLSIRRQGASAAITGFLVNAIDRPASELNAFRLTDVSLDNTIVVLLAISAIGVTAMALRKIWTSRLFRRRWLWSLGSLLGIGKLTTIWGSAALNVSAAYMSIFPISVIKQGILQPWQIGTTIPGIALWALLRRSKKEVAEEALS